MFPIRDTAIRRHVPWMTWALIAANVAVFVQGLRLPPELLEEALMRLAVVPGRYVAPGRVDLSGPWTPFLTSMFLHAGLLHLLGNMWTLWLFGDNVEDRMGPLRFTAFYLLCGLASMGVHVATNPGSTVPVLGASGAISGVMGAYLVMFPLARVVVLVPLFFWPLFFEIPALLYLGFWFWLQVVEATAVLGTQPTGGVAWWAHVGGFVAGIALLPLFVRRDRWQRRDPGYLPRGPRRPRGRER
jgi:membrane associated rhomboid family serine protease